MINPIEQQTFSSVESLMAYLIDNLTIEFKFEECYQVPPDSRYKKGRNVLVLRPMSFFIINIYIVWEDLEDIRWGFHLGDDFDLWGFNIADINREIVSRIKSLAELDSAKAKYKIGEELVRQGRLWVKPQ
jgi:hypothetical protein